MSQLETRTRLPPESYQLETRTRFPPSAKLENAECENNLGPDWKHEAEGENKKVNSQKHEHEHERWPQKVNS